MFTISIQNPEVNSKGIGAVNDQSNISHSTPRSGLQSCKNLTSLKVLRSSHWPAGPLLYCHVILNFCSNMTLAALKFKKRTQGTYVRLSFYVHYAKGFSLLYLLGQKITKASATALGGWLVFPILRASSLVGPQLLISATVLKGFPLLSPLYHIHFEITVDPCNLIGSQQCDLLLNPPLFCSKSLLF